MSSAISGNSFARFKLKDQARFVEMAAKHFGLLNDTVEHKGEIRIRWLGD